MRTIFVLEAIALAITASTVRAQVVLTPAEIDEKFCLSDHITDADVALYARSEQDKSLKKQVDQMLERAAAPCVAKYGWDNGKRMFAGLLALANVDVELARKAVGDDALADRVLKAFQYLQPKDIVPYSGVGGDKLPDTGVAPIAAALEKAGIPRDEVSDVVLGYFIALATFSVLSLGWDGDPRLNN